MHGPKIDVLTLSQILHDYPVCGIWAKSIADLQPASRNGAFCKSRALPRAEFLQVFSLFDWAAIMRRCHPILVQTNNLIGHRIEFQ